MAFPEIRRADAPTIGLAATLGVAAACWAVAAWQMRGMDMGVATGPGSFGSFAAIWVTMMAAMMLPGAASAVARYARVQGSAGKAAVFAGSYLGIWALIGVAAYVLDRPHGSLAAGLVLIAAGGYELTPVKRHLRRRCREEAGSGLGYALCCAGSSAGLMAAFVALDVMSLFWMAVVTVIATAQKLLPPKARIDIPVAVALAGLGFVIVAGLTPPTM